MLNVEKLLMSGIDLIKMMMVVVVDFDGAEKFWRYADPSSMEPCPSH